MESSSSDPYGLLSLASLSLSLQSGLSSGVVPSLLHTRPQLQPSAEDEPVVLFPDVERRTVHRRKSRRQDNAQSSRAGGSRLTCAVGGVSGGNPSLGRIINEMFKRHIGVPPLGSHVPTSSQRFDGSHLPPVTSERGNGGVQFVSQPSPRQKRVLILMSDTGGGHRASAEAIKQAFQIEYGDSYQVTVIDLWKEHTPWPFNQMPKSYSFLVKHETLWKVAFHFTRPKFVHQPQMAATSAFVAREVAKGLDQHRPDVIVSVHPLMQHVPLRVLHTRGLYNRIPFTTVVTDLTGCHPTWFHRLASLCFCATQEVAQQARKSGLKPEQLRIHGLPIRPAFCAPTAPKDVTRRELGMHPSLPAAILIGGGEGMGPVEATARALASALSGSASPPSAKGQPQQQQQQQEGQSGSAQGQLIVICGRNKKLKERLEAVDWPVPTLIKGFVTNMPEVMAACDCIITKAGPGTIAESFIRGLPLILNDFIAGQEAGNVPFVVNNGAGKFCEDPRKIARIVADWFGPKSDELKQMAANAVKLGRPDAVFKIVRDLDELVKNKEKETDDLSQYVFA